MTIEKIKNNIDSKKGNNVKVIYNGSRNKREEYEGIIKEVYNYIFIICVYYIYNYFKLLKFKFPFPSKISFIDVFLLLTAIVLL